MSFFKSVGKTISKNGFGFCLIFLKVIKNAFKKWFYFHVLAGFFGQLQIHISQSSAYVGSFLIPFFKYVGNNLSKNGVGIFLMFLEVVTKCI